MEKEKAAEFMEQYHEKTKQMRKLQLLCEHLKKKLIYCGNASVDLKGFTKNQEDQSVGFIDSSQITQFGAPEQSPVDQFKNCLGHVGSISFPRSSTPTLNPFTNIVPNTSE